MDALAVRSVVGFRLIVSLLLLDSSTMVGWPIAQTENRISHAVLDVYQRLFMQRKR